jgi:hypothetical protein
MSQLARGAYHKLPKRLRRTLRRTHGNFHGNVSFAVLWFTRKRRIRTINEFESKVYSQNGEDGILRVIFHLIGTTNRFCVEFGVGDGRECNTRYFIEKRGWRYLHMDANNSTSPPTRNEHITAENINSLLTKYKVPQEFDLLSIDIDYNTYWVWKAIAGYQPRVAVIEYNSCIPPNESKAVKYDPNGVWDGSAYFGASLLALAILGKAKGYTLVGCDNNGVNSFFVRDELALPFVPSPLGEIYRPPRYGLRADGKYIGYPPVDERYFSWVPI